MLIYSWLGILHSFHKDMSAERIWKLYMTLTKVENAFHSLKSDLGLRHVHHQLAKRTEGHLFISVLAYYILISIEYQLRIYFLHISELQ